jgi:ubiquinone/menaquinone biosynthesis C-methylase UbiE
MIERGMEDRGRPRVSEAGMHVRDDFWSSWVQTILVLESSRSRRFRPELKEPFFEYLGLFEYARVLDVGCGPGTFARYLARYIKPPGLIWGIDRDRTFIEYARRRAEKRGVSGYMKYAVADALALPFDDGTFDSVTSYTLIEHAPNPEVLVREMARVCKPGGTISVMAVLSVESEHGLLRDPFDRRIEELFRKFRKAIEPLEEAYHVGRGLPIEEIPRLFERLSLVEIRISGFYTPFCLDDARYPLAEKERILREELTEPTEGFVSRLFEAFPEEFGEGSPARAEAEELLRLVRERCERRLHELRSGVRRWTVEGRPSLIVSGRKGKAP